MTNATRSTMRNNKVFTKINPRPMRLREAAKLAEEHGDGAILVQEYKEDEDGYPLYGVILDHRNYHRDELLREAKRHMSETWRISGGNTP